ncbi:MAG TPA: hypothetical protein VF796_10205 [Humisphaera sp.]
MRSALRGGRRAAVAVIALLTHAAYAQPAPATADADDRLRRLEQRLDEMERRYKAELEAKDAEIARLRGLPAARPTGTPTTGPATTPAVPGVDDLLGEIDAAGRPGTPPGGAAPPALGPATRDVLRDADDRSRPFTIGRAPASFNPDVAVVSDFLGSYSSNRRNDALNRVDVREVELDLRAAVDPRADAVAVLAFARDAENPVFPNPGEPPSGPDTSVDIEEAYLFLHDFGVPNLTAKLGRFHVRFGRQNVLHLHDLPTSDPSFVQQAFLAPESLTDSGLSLSYVVPPRLVGGQYVEAVVEVLAGEGAGSESPTLRGDLSADSPAFNAHLLWNTDLSKDWNMELGASWLTGRQDADASRRANLYGVDVTLVRRDPTGRFDNRLVQAEAIYFDGYDGDGNKRNGWGAYLLGQQQLDRDWFAGVRLDYTKDPYANAREAWGVSPYVSWYWSEFLRFRLEYQHKAGDVPTENNLFLQATWIFGAHPPHPYWAMR